MSPEVARYYRPVYVARYGASFAAAVAFVLAREIELDRNGQVRVERDPSDPGGTTKYGIDARGHKLKDSEVAALTEAEAVDFYHRIEWAAIRGDVLNQASLATVLLDTAVNPGMGVVVRWLQSALHLNADGLFGPLTLTEVQHLDGTTTPAVILEILRRREAYYHARPEEIDGRIFRDKYLAGWLDRVRLLRREVGLPEFYVGTVKP